MSLITKAIKQKRSWSDGVRISVMSRHTLSDGVTPDPDISASSFDEHWPQLAPPATLIGAYYKRGLSWEVFADQFNQYLMTAEVRLHLLNLIRLALAGNVTILCIESSPEKCHRRLIAETCSVLNPSLEVLLQ